MTWPRFFSFWAITIGSVVNDLEFVPLLILSRSLAGSRGFMHSVLGVLTLNALITVLAVRFLVPPALRWAGRRWPESPRIFLFAGQDLRKDPRDWLTLYTSAAFGGLTHLIIDLPTHGYNPWLWPWQTVPFSILPFADDPWWDILAGIPVLLALVWMLWRFWRR